MNASPVPDENANGVQQTGNGTIMNPVRSDLYMKLLVPNAAVGALLGRGGDYVSKLQQETGTKIKMSRPNEFYPSTTDRICLISGSFDSVAHSCGLIIRKICERSSDTNNQTNGSETEVNSPTPRRTNGERAKQVKLLVTNSTAGMVIGKGGCNIKEIKEESGAVIQISQKANASSNGVSLNNQSSSHAERLITISGDFEELDRALQLILRKIEADPQSSSCVSISYADANANVSPSGVIIGGPTAFHGASQPAYGEPIVSPRFASLRSRNDTNGASNERNNGMQFDGRPMRNMTGFAGHPTAVDQSESAAGQYGASNQRSGNNLDQIATMLRLSGYAEPAVVEITSAMNTLMIYGLLSINVDPQNAGGNSLQYSFLGGMQPQAMNGAQHPSLAVPSSGFQTNAFAAQTGYQQAAYPPAAYMRAAGQNGSNASTNATYLPSSASAQAGSYVNSGAPMQSNDDALSLSSASYSMPVQSSALVDVDPNASASSAAFAAVHDGQTMVPFNVYEVINQSGLQQLGALQSGAVSLSALNSAGLLGPGLPMANLTQISLADSGAMQQRFVDDGSGTNGAAVVQRDVKVHESMIGVIFGVGGKWIAELQSQTGASIQVSKKGVFAPATHDRVVTLKGGPANVAQAYNMILQKLNGEEERRATRRQTRGDRQSADSEYAATA